VHAHDRFLPEWFNRIRSRQITLPRFQRFEAWGHSEVSDLLTTVLRGLPAGAALILEVGDEEKFRSRTMIDAPDSGERVTEQLLDGQQRLTALWRSLNDTYPDRTYLVQFEQDPSDSQRLPRVYGQARWMKNGRRYPLWVDDPAECWKRETIPIRLLRPDDIFSDIRQWTRMAVADDYEQRDKLYDQIISLRDRVKAFNLPYLALPAGTPKDVALDVFIKMNSSSVRLSTYDIAVVLVEDDTGQSLHEHVEALHYAVPRAAEYADLPGLVLDVVALRQDYVPSQASYQRIDYAKMLMEWDAVTVGIRGMVEFLEDESVFDDQRLPSYPAIPIIAALWEYLPTHPDARGNARHLLRKFLWRAFLTSRYEQSSTTHALQDYRGLKKALCEGAADGSAPIFDEGNYPLPTKEMILQADWPKKKNILARGLLALQMKCGAEDLADGAKATVASITSKEHPREYHHLFPASILEEAGIPDEMIFLALNCALVTWRTNRVISNRDPISYLRERAIGSALGDEMLKQRLRTHLIPYDQLAVGYAGMSDDQRRIRVDRDYRAFLLARAEIIARAAQRACEGRPLDPNELFSNAE